MAENVRPNTLGTVLKQILPRRLIRLRERHALTQRSLAEGAGLGVSTVNEIESGLASDVMLSTILMIAARFEVTPDYLLGFDFQDLSMGWARSDGKLGEELAHMADAGWSEGALAARLGISVAAVHKIIEDEWEARRLRRVR